MDDKNKSYKSLIMVVDDNPEFIEGVRLTLEVEGFNVWTADDGQQALDKLHAALKGDVSNAEEPHQLPDLILADVMMPVMDGYDFYERVQANPYLNRIPFIFLTARTTDLDIRRGKELGVDDYLSKPCSAEDLLSSIRGKLRRVKQRWVVATEYAGETPSESLSAKNLIVLSVMLGLVVVACLGMTLFTGWLG